MGVFSEIERYIIETTEEVCQKALKASAEEIKKDFMAKVLFKVTESYYTEFSPKQYNRIESLYGIWSTDYVMGDMSFSLEFEADESKMPQHRSKSWYHQGGGSWISRDDGDFTWGQNNGMPENDWIFENFLQGIHPRHVLIGDLVYDLSIQRKDIESRLDPYINAYQDKAENILIKHLKAQCAAIM